MLESLLASLLSAVCAAAAAVLAAATPEPVRPRCPPLAPGVLCDPSRPAASTSRSASRCSVSKGSLSTRAPTALATAFARSFLVLIASCESAVFTQCRHSRLWCSLAAGLDAERPPSLYTGRAAAADTGRARGAVKRSAAPDLWLCAHAGGARRGVSMGCEARWSPIHHYGGLPCRGATLRAR
jgi:hypothetical protein